MSNDNESLPQSEKLHNVMKRASELIGLSEAEKNSLFFETQNRIQSRRATSNQPLKLDEIKCSYILGITQALHVLYPDMARARVRLRLPSSDHPFNGKSAIDLMLTGTEGLRLTRRYFDYHAQPH